MRAEAQDLETLAALPHEAVLVIGDPALKLAATGAYAHRYDLGEEWKRWTGKPFVFAVWAATRSAGSVSTSLAHNSLLASRAWGLAHLNEIAVETARLTALPAATCREYLSGLDYAFSDAHRAALSDFFRRAGVPQFMQVA